MAQKPTPNPNPSPNPNPDQASDAAAPAQYDSAVAANASLMADEEEAMVSSR